jgi:hypothetical protein
MNTETEYSLGMNRRDAIKRAGLALGAAISASTLSGVAFAQSNRSGASWKPVNLKRRQADVAGAIAERILPKTDTPGALDVGVPEFMDIMYGGYLTKEEKSTFAKGLNAMNQKARKAHKMHFAELSGVQQDDLIRELAGDSKNREFYKKIRELTLVGYFTSKEVGMNVLKYDPIPGMYKECIPLSETGNVSWSYS